MEGAAPRSVNYADTLPLAVSSTQNRRSYYPQNGQSFTDTGSNIIRIDVNADGLLDTQQSYLEFKLVNGTTRSRCLDQGHCWIKRLTIESAGVILEDINNYNRLIAGILQPAQGSAAYTGEIQLAQNSGAQTDTAATATRVPVTTFQNFMGAVNDSTHEQQGGPGVIDGQDAANATGVIGDAGEVVGQYHLCCGFLNMDRYLPLVLMGQGFTIQLELETGASIG
eukprot:SAG11_NODE_6876_length_1232_cov_4.709620_1_plen_223_part_10